MRDILVKFFYFSLITTLAKGECTPKCNREEMCLRYQDDFASPYYYKCSSELSCIFQENDDNLCPETAAIKEVPPVFNIIGTLVNYESSGPLLGYWKGIDWAYGLYQGIPHAPSAIALNVIATNSLTDQYCLSFDYFMNAPDTPSIYVIWDDRDNDLWDYNNLTEITKNIPYSNRVLVVNTSKEGLDSSLPWPNSKITIPSSNSMYRQVMILINPGNGPRTLCGIDEIVLTLGPCIGSWSEWENGICSQPCGDGTMNRTRTCPNGAQCLDNNEYKTYQTQNGVYCKLKSCDCNFDRDCTGNFTTCVNTVCKCKENYSLNNGKCTGSWSEWLNGTCSQSCGDGIMNRSRVCPNGAQCLDNNEYKTYQTQNGVYCKLKTCDCNGGCTGNFTICVNNICICQQNYFLNNGKCTGNWGDWVNGTCSQPCGDGLLTRTRMCNDGLQCIADGLYMSVQIQNSIYCNLKPCDCNGGCIGQFTTCVNNICQCQENYSLINGICTGNWGDWVNGTCSQPCGDGYLTRTRTCNNGLQCIADGLYKSVQIQNNIYCNLKPCDCNGGCTGQFTTCVNNVCQCQENYSLVNGNCTGNWGDWVNGTCSQPCGDGLLIRSRTCNNGLQCIADGMYKSVQIQSNIYCNLKPCDCNGGCTGQFTTCVNNVCQCQGNYSLINGTCTGNWGDWVNGTCSQPCGNGYLTRTRTCNKGLQCIADGLYQSVQVQNNIYCYLKPCDCNGGCTDKFTTCVNNVCQCQGNYSLINGNCTGNWGDWINGTCSQPCGDGLLTRTRICNNGLQCIADGMYKSRQIQNNIYCNLKPCDCNIECTGQFTTCVNNVCQCQGNYSSINGTCTGNWGDWVNGTCSQPCGDGYLTRTRFCNNGLQCIADGLYKSVQIQDNIYCNLKPCDCNGGCTDKFSTCVNNVCECQGNYSLINGNCTGNWGNWVNETCSQPCGDGFLTRRRTCNNGLQCIADGLYKSVQIQSNIYCNLKPCDCNGGCTGQFSTCVNNVCQCQGNYSLINGTCTGNWGDWVNGTCSQPCGDGYLTRTRSCKNDLQCIADGLYKSVQIQDNIYCNLKPCDCHGGCTDKFSTCVNNVCQCQGNYSLINGNCTGNWGDWVNGTCSQPCGEGYLTRTRFCNNGLQCIADGLYKSVQIQSNIYCNLKPCDCNGGCIDKFSTCVNNVCQCQGNYSLINGNCTGNWGDWVNGTCSQLCGDGYFTRTRSCNNGLQCIADGLYKSVQIQDNIYCNLKPCDCNGGCTGQFTTCVNNVCQCQGNYSLINGNCTGNWGNWVNGTCSQPCGDGYLTRTRSCNNGLQCIADGLYKSVQIQNNIYCNLKPCDCNGGCTGQFTTCVNSVCQCQGNYSSINGTCTGNWGDWVNGTCSQPCGNGFMTRNRTCNNGLQCITGGVYKSVQIQNNINCNLKPCDCNGGCTGQFTTCVNNVCQCQGNYSSINGTCTGNWGDWVNGTCSQPCGNGFMTRNRTCNNGLQCITGGVYKSVQIQNNINCNLKPCDCNGGCTGQFTACVNNVCQCQGNYSSINGTCTGNWGDWVNGTCSQPCGNGFMTRNRTCINGLQCITGGVYKSVQIQNNINCNLKPCDCNIGYVRNSTTQLCQRDSNWTAISDCNAVCNGNQTFQYNNVPFTVVDEPCSLCQGYCGVNSTCLCSNDAQYADNNGVCQNYCNIGYVRNSTTLLCQRDSNWTAISDCNAVCNGNQTFQYNNVPFTVVDEPCSLCQGYCGVNSTCLCSNDAQYADNNGVCQNYCNIGYVRNSTTLLCQRDSNWTAISDCNAVCNGNQTFQYNNVPFTVVDEPCSLCQGNCGINSICLCSKNTQYADSNGVCQNCGVNERVFLPSVTCDCDIGYLRNATTLLCQRDSNWTAISDCNALCNGNQTFKYKFIPFTEVVEPCNLCQDCDIGYLRNATTLLCQRDSNWTAISDCNALCNGNQTFKYKFIPFTEVVEPCSLCQGYCGANSTCLCSKNTQYADDNGVCQNCGINEHVIPPSTTCDCDIGYLRNATTLFCQRDSNWSPTSDCNALCNGNQTFKYKFIPFTEVVEPCSLCQGYCDINLKCSCLNETQYADSDGVCQNCGINERVIPPSVTCGCDTGYVRNSTTLLCQLV
nr:neurogenic locus notch homolog protein 1 isoform X12 [Hydra vulgaris]